MDVICGEMRLTYDEPVPAAPDHLSLLHVVALRVLGATDIHSYTIDPHDNHTMTVTFSVGDREC